MGLFKKKKQITSCESLGDYLIDRGDGLIIGSVIASEADGAKIDAIYCFASGTVTNIEIDEDDEDDIYIRMRLDEKLSNGWSVFIDYNFTNCEVDIEVGEHFDQGDKLAVVGVDWEFRMVSWHGPYASKLYQFDLSVFLNLTRIPKGFYMEVYNSNIVDKKDPSLFVSIGGFSG